MSTVIGLFGFDAQGSVILFIMIRLLHLVFSARTIWTYTGRHPRFTFYATQDLILTKI